MSLTLKEYTSELWVKIKRFISSNYSTKANTISGLTVSGKVITYTKGDGSTGTITTQDTNTTYGNMTAATASAAGKAGLVPAPAAGKQTSFLRGDGTWVVPTNTTYSFSNKAATLAWNNAVTVATVGGVDITVKLPANPNTDTHWTTTMYAGAKDAKSNAATTNGNAYIKLFDNSTVRSQLNIKGSGATRVTTDANGAIIINSTDTNTTYSKLSQFTNDSGFITGITKGMVTTALGYTPPTKDTNTWNALKGSTKSAAGTAGYAPAPAAGAANRYLRCDGTWQVPPDNNTTYGAATQSANGLMTAADKKKLDGIANGANKYSLPASPSVTSLTVTNSNSAGVVFGSYRVYVG